MLNFPLGIADNPALSSVTLDDNYNEPTPKFVLDYIFEPMGSVHSLMAYVSAAKGSIRRLHGINIFNLGDATWPPLRRQNWTYEGGFKTEAFDNRVRFNAAYFWADISDLTANATVGSSFPVQNVGDAEVHGFELELTALPMDNLTLYATAAFDTGPTAASIPQRPGLVPSSWVSMRGCPRCPTWAYTLGVDVACFIRFLRQQHVPHRRGLVQYG